MLALSRYAFVKSELLHLIDLSCEPSRCERLICKAREVGDGIPIDAIEVEADCHPALGTQVGGNEKSLRITSHETSLLAQARLAAEGNHAVTVVVKEIVGEDALTNPKREMVLAGCLGHDLRERVADLQESCPPCNGLRQLSCC